MNSTILNTGLNILSQINDKVNIKTLVFFDIEFSSYGSIISKNKTYQYMMNNVPPYMTKIKPSFYPFSKICAAMIFEKKNDNWQLLPINTISRNPDFTNNTMKFVSIAYPFHKYQQTIQTQHQPTSQEINFGNQLFGDGLRNDLIGQKIIFDVYNALLDPLALEPSQKEINNKKQAIYNLTLGELQTQDINYVNKYIIPNFPTKTSAETTKIYQFYLMLYDLIISKECRLISKGVNDIIALYNTFIKLDLFVAYDVIEKCYYDISEYSQTFGPGCKITIIDQLRYVISTDDPPTTDTSLHANYDSICEYRKKNSMKMTAENVYNFLVKKYSPVISNKLIKNLVTNYGIDIKILGGVHTPIYDVYLQLVTIVLLILDELAQFYITNKRQLHKKIVVDVKREHLLIQFKKNDLVKRHLNEIDADLKKQKQDAKLMNIKKQHEIEQREIQVNQQFTENLIKLEKTLKIQLQNIERNKLIIIQEKVAKDKQIQEAFDIQIAKLKLKSPLSANATEFVPKSLISTAKKFILPYLKGGNLHYKPKYLKYKKKYLHLKNIH
jgi:hypothetical protein